MFHLFAPCGKLIHRAPVNYINLVGAESQSRSCRVHGDIAAADNGNPAAFHDRRIGIRKISTHQIAPSEKFICGINSAECLSRDTHKIRQSRARAYENSFIAHSKKLVYSQRFSYDDICFYIDAEPAQSFDLFCNYIFRQTKFRYTVYKYTARRMKRFVNRNGIAFLCKVARTGESGGSRADDSHSVSVRLWCAYIAIAESIVPIGDKPFKPAYADRFAFQPAHAL